MTQSPPGPVGSRPGLSLEELAAIELFAWLTVCSKKITVNPVLIASRIFLRQSPVACVVTAKRKRRNELTSTICLQDFLPKGLFTSFKLGPLTSCKPQFSCFPTSHKHASAEPAGRDVSNERSHKVDRPLKDNFPLRTRVK